jgi:type I restriction enzyme R subunit
VQDYHSEYIDFYQEFRGKHKEKENITDDIVFEMELIKQVEINLDYIMELIRKYHEKHCTDKEIKITIDKAIDSSMELRNKKDLIEQFIASLAPNINIDDKWSEFLDIKKTEELNRIIKEENLKKAETETLIKNAFQTGFIQEAGMAIPNILPPSSPFASGNQYAEKKERVIEKLKTYMERFLGT